MPKRYGITPHSRKVGVSARIDEDTYIEISSLSYSLRESNSYLYRELLRGALKTLELAKENPQLIEGNPHLVWLSEAPRRKSGDEPVHEGLQVHHILERIAELEAKVDEQQK